MENQKNIVLIGLSGVGKTTIARALSKVLNKEFIDTDNLIEEETGMEISEVFSLYGEEYFRGLESKTINRIYKNKNIIIATGGGIVLDKDNIIKLKENGIVVLLESSIENIMKNIRNSNINRPLLNNDDLFQSLKSLYDNRKELYLNAANYVINIDNKLIDDIVYEIFEKCVKI